MSDIDEVGISALPFLLRPIFIIFSPGLKASLR
jgi:hypothetical protein